MKITGNSFPFTNALYELVRLLCLFKTMSKIDSNTGSKWCDLNFQVGLKFEN